MILKISVIMLAGLGVLGTLLPVFPGTPLIVLASLIYGLVMGLEAVGWQLILGLGIMSLIAEASKYLFSTLGAKYFGSSKPGIIGAIVGLIIGLFILGPLGLVIGPFLGSILAELITGRQLEEAIKVGVGAIAGQLGGSLLSFFISLLMVGWFLTAIM